ncbi:MAG: hypothetical protein ACLKAK_05700 [Alkaliphilus sp.]
MLANFFFLRKSEISKKNYKAVLAKLFMEAGFLVALLVVASIASQAAISEKQVIIVVYGLLSLTAAYFLFMPKLSLFTIDLAHLEFLYMTPNYFLIVLAIKFFLVNLNLLIYSLVFMIIDLKIISMPEQIHWITLYCFLAVLANITWIRFNSSKARIITLQLISIVVIFLSVLISDFLVIYWILMLIISSVYAFRISGNINYEKYRKTCKYTTLYTKYFFAGDFAGLMIVANELKDEKVIKSIELSRFYYKGWKSIAVKDLVTCIRMPIMSWLVIVIQLSIGFYIVKYEEKIAIAGIWFILIILMGLFSKCNRKNRNVITSGFMYPLTNRELLIGSIIIPVILSVIILSSLLIFVTPSFLLLRLFVLNMSVSIAIPVLAFLITFHRGIKVRLLIYLGVSLAAGVLHVIV